MLHYMVKRTLMVGCSLLADYRRMLLYSPSRLSVWLLAGGLRKQRYIKMFNCFFHFLSLSPLSLFISFSHSFDFTPHLYLPTPPQQTS
ncbi:hypothetical protein N657DRAFT_415869 [Parathielavia appendiculata]|uniref:Uncharacterized protein n=1 Tax=Parathielavia appendiculata TaxID=2587402 RepID=A0AAN6TZE9_9PEZI|nr:hypothetical protein N657DRAFT_415869 [Parathielavia appendiculata]